MRASIIIATAEPTVTPLTQKCVATLIEHHGIAAQISVAHDEARNLYRTWNWAAEQTAGEALVFLNNDTISKGPWLGNLLREIERFPNHDLITGVRLRTEQDLPRKVTHQTGERFLQGWCFACRRALWERLRFDESFTLYFGDTDFMARADCPLHAVPAIEGNLLHLGHQSTKLRPDRRDVWQRDRTTFIKKWS